MLYLGTPQEPAYVRAGMCKLTTTTNKKNPKQK